MKKYRIAKAGSLYYPQWRWRFSWYSFYKELDGYDHMSVVVFDSKDKAINYLEKNEVTYSMWERN